jgi:hypothetical protein
LLNPVKNNSIGVIIGSVLGSAVFIAAISGFIYVLKNNSGRIYHQEKKRKISEENVIRIHEIINQNEDSSISMVK